MSKLEQPTPYPRANWFNGVEDLEAERKMEAMASAGHADADTLVMPAVARSSEQDGPYGWTEVEQPKPIGDSQIPAAEEESLGDNLEPRIFLLSNSGGLEGPFGI